MPAFVSLNWVVVSLLQACVFLRIVAFHPSRGRSEFVSLHLLRFEDAGIARQNCCKYVRERLQHVIER